MGCRCFYHKTCYDRFVYFYRKIPKESPLLNEEVSNQSTENEFFVLISFFSFSGFDLLSGLPVELRQLYEMYCTDENIRDNKKIKYFLQENFKESICFWPTRGIHGNPIMVHAHEVNPIDYAIASIIGAGLRDEEITISLAKMIHRKIKVQETGTSFPLSAENLLVELDKYDPIKEIYNVISLSDNPLVPKNKFGYADPKSSVKANKIWYEC